MAESSILREYLVALGFDVKSDEFRKFSAALESVTKGVTVLGAALATGTAAMETLVKKTSDHFADLYYSGQRVGDTVQNLEAWRVGAQQAGLTADQASGAIENFSQAIRLQPGLAGVLKGFGIDTTESKVKQLVDLVNHLRTLPTAVSSQYGSMFGIDPDTLLLLEKKLPQVAAGMDAYRDKLQKAGIDADALAEKSRKMSLAFNNFDNDLGNLAARLEDDFLPAATKLLDWADKAVVKFNELDTASHGWVGRIAGAATVLGGILGIKALPKLIGKAFGRGAAATGGAEAAGGGAAAAETAAGTTAAAAAGGGILTPLGASIVAVLGPLAAFLAVMKPTATQSQALEDQLLAKAYGKRGPSSAPVSNEGGILGLIRKLEGSGDRAISPAGAVGRYQIMPDTARRLGGDPSKLMDPSYAAGLAKSAVVDIIQQGAKTLDEILVGYNSSPKFLKRFIASHDDPSVLLPETQKYLAHAHRLLSNNPFLDDVTRSLGNLGSLSGAITGQGGMTIRNDIHNEFHIQTTASSKETAEEVAKLQGRVYGDVVRDGVGATR